MLQFTKGIKTNKSGVFASMLERYITSRRAFTSGSATRVTALAVALLFTGVLSACSGIPFTDSTPKVKLNFKAASDLNPDASGRPSPVVVRIYELKSPLAFDNTEFFELYDRDKDALGGDLLAVEEREVFPNESFELKKTLTEGSTALGILAAYRDIDNAGWRQTIVIAEGDTAKGDIVLSREAISYVQD